MTKKASAPFDEIGYWSELKLDIVRKYAAAYSKILAAQTKTRLHHSYIDAFAGPGVNISKSTGNFVLGSPLNALRISPPFQAYHLIDIDQKKTDLLRKEVGDRPDVHVYEGDCNKILLEQVFPMVRFEDYRRALCLLDPYGLHLDWQVIETAGKMKSIDIFLNFPVMDMNRNVLWRKPEGVAPEDIQRMTRFWGDESWRNIAYSSKLMLFPDMEEKQSNETIAKAFCDRIRTVADFPKVSDPLPMRNSTGAVVYFLIFASQKEVARHIVRDIFNDYRGHRG